MWHIMEVVKVEIMTEEWEYLRKKHGEDKKMREVFVLKDKEDYLPRWA